MAYLRGQPNFIGATVDSRDGYDHGSNRTPNDIRSELGRQPINIPVIAASGARYSSGTYPGLRGGSGSIPIDREALGRQQANSVIVQQAEPASAKSYRSSVSTQVSSTGQLPSYAGSLNAFDDAMLSQNSTSSYVGGTSSLPHRRRSDGLVMSTESLPSPVSSQIVYTPRVMPGGPTGVAGKVSVASSRRTDYQPGVVSDATPVSHPPQLRQIPIVVVPSQAVRPDSSRQAPDQRALHHTKSYQESHPQSRSVNSQNVVSSVSRSQSVDPRYAKEAEVDALTDLLVQNMNVAGNPDFCGMCVKCGRSVMGEKSRCVALDQLFHVDCFRCTACNNCLSGQPFYAMEGQPYCELCYMQTLEKCSVCSKPVVDRLQNSNGTYGNSDGCYGNRRDGNQPRVLASFEMLRATGKPYHPRCFTCVVCGKNLDGFVFTVDATNQIHCIEDFHRKFAPRCSVCSLSIMPSNTGDKETVRIVVLDRNFHMECFRCEDCGMVLSSESDGRGCYPLDDHILCKMCNARRIQILTGKVTTDL